jgi:hypothetical protein
MTSTPTPVPSPVDPTKHLLSLIFHSVWHGLWAAATSSPLAAAFAIVAIAIAVTGFVRAILHGGNPRDPIRRFNRADKALILAWAGGRCEQDGLFGRCRQTEGLEADHVHPWSRGGQTAIANGQALCRRHNRDKRAAVPYGWQLRALEKRRATYYPPGASRTVVRRTQTARPTRIRRTRVR